LLFFKDELGLRLRSTHEPIRPSVYEVGN